MWRIVRNIWLFFETNKKKNDLQHFARLASNNDDDNIAKRLSNFCEMVVFCNSGIHHGSLVNTKDSTLHHCKQVSGHSLSGNTIRDVGEMQREKMLISNRGAHHGSLANSRNGVFAMSASNIDADNIGSEK